MKINPLFILFCLIVLISQKLIFSDAIIVVSDQYPLMVFVLPLIVLALPLDFDRPLLLISSFLIGIVFDVFNDTLGINSFAMVMLAYLRNPILSIIQPRQGYKSGVSNFRTYGISWVILYLILSLVVFAFTFFMIDAFTFVYIKKILFSTVLSTLASLPFGVFLLMILKSS